MLASISNKTLHFNPVRLGCGEGLGKKEQLINAPENKPRRTTSHLAPCAMEARVMSLAPLHWGVCYSTGPVPSPFRSPQWEPVGRAGSSLCPGGGTAWPPPPKPPQEPWEMMVSSSPLVPYKAAAAPAAPVSPGMGTGVGARATNQASDERGQGRWW